MVNKSGKAPYISEDEFSFTLDAIWSKDRYNLRNICVFYFSHFLGLRSKELASLKIGDVYDTKRSLVKETVRLIGAYTKGNKFREVFLVHDDAKQYLIDYLAQRDLSDPSAPLFLSQKNRSFSADTMRKMIKICYQKAGINATSHSGRRSFATRLIRKNVDIYSIKELMGHSDISITQEYFATDPNLLKQAIIKLNQ